MQSPDSTYLKTTCYSDEHRYFVTGVVAYQRCGFRCLELCATNDTIDLIEERCVPHAKFLLCVCLFVTQPNKRDASSPPGIEMTVLLAAA